MLEQIHQKNIRRHLVPTVSVGMHTCSEGQSQLWNPPKREQTVFGIDTVIYSRMYSHGDRDYRDIHVYGANLARYAFPRRPWERGVRGTLHYV